MSFNLFKSVLKHNWNDVSDTAALGIFSISINYSMEFIIHDKYVYIYIYLYICLCISISIHIYISVSAIKVSNEFSCSAQIWNFQEFLCQTRLRHRRKHTHTHTYRLALTYIYTISLTSPIPLHNTHTPPTVHLAKTQRIVQTKTRQTLRMSNASADADKFAKKLASFACSHPSPPPSA